MEKFFILWLHIILSFVLGEISANNIVECNNPFYKVGEKCLHFGNLGILELNQSEAVEYCKDIGGSLVMIQTATQFKDIIDYINENNYLNDYWIDGSDLKEEGKWVFHNEELVPMGTPFWYVKGDDSGWYQEPNDLHGEDCLHMLPNLHMLPKPTFYLNDHPCNFVKRPLCEESSESDDDDNIFNSKHISIHQKYVTESTLDCPVPYVPVGDTCLAFLFYAATMTWPEAVLTCEAMAGNLAKIDDPELLRSIYLYLHEHVISEESFWLGGSDQDQEGTWVWLDGSPVPIGPPMWGYFDDFEQPFLNASTNCLGLLSDGYHYFRDDNCEDSSTYKPLCMPIYQNI